MELDFSNLFDLKEKTAVITGGGGVLCRALAINLAQVGVKVAILCRTIASGEPVVQEIMSNGGKAIVIECDMLNKSQIIDAHHRVKNNLGKTDILINGVGGNKIEASVSPDKTFFDLTEEALQWVFNLNLMTALLSSQVFGKEMAENHSGVILNISSMNAYRPLTRIPAYSAAKAGVNNFTQWLAVHMAQEYSPAIRVNAIAPGFFITEQTRFLLTDLETGDLSERGRKVIEHTPMGRFGVPQDLVGTALWLLSPASEFVTGAVIPVDGGFSAYSGV